METPKLENKTIKKIIPVKGNLRKNLLKKFKESRSLHNGSEEATSFSCSQNSVVKVENPLKSPDNKIIIQKVESVKLDQIITNPKAPPRRISSLFKEQNRVEKYDQKPTQENLGINEKQELTEKIAVHFQSHSDPSLLKLLTAKIPDNNCNTVVPLKMIRTIKGPKPKPNLLHRIHRVQTTNTSESRSTTDQLDYSSVEFEVLLPEITMIEQKQVPVLPGPIACSKLGFDGFETLEASVKFDVGLWKDVLINLPQEKKVGEKSKRNLPVALKALASISQELNFKSPEKHNKLSSVTKELNVVKPKSQSDEEKTKRSEEDKFSTKTEHELSSSAGKLLGIVSQNKVIKETDPPSIQRHTAKLLTSKDTVIRTLQEPEVNNKLSANLPSEIDRILTPSTSESSLINESKDELEKSDWMEDILTVIGTSRIHKIDESLKEIPNLITGSFSAIETENVEFKLIIKHLLRELGVESIMQTLKFAPRNESSLLSVSSKDRDDDNDELNESYDGDSNEPNNFTENSHACDETFEEDIPQNPSNFPGTSISVATSFEEVPSWPFRCEPSVIPDNEKEETSLSDEKVQQEDASLNTPASKTETVTDKPIIENMESLDIESKTETRPKSRKRKIKSPSPISDYKPKEEKDVLVTSTRLGSRKSLRLSSRESSTEPQTSSKIRPNKIKSENDSDENDVIRKRRMGPMKPLSDDSEDDSETKKPNGEAHSDSIDSPLAKRTKNTKNLRKPKNDRKKKTSKIFDSDSASLSPEKFDSYSKMGLKSRLEPLDFDSSHKSLTPNHYFTTSDQRNSTESTEIHSMLEKFATKIAEKKDNDPSYVEPTVIETRPRLRTSAFKGTEREDNNQVVEKNECLNDENIHENSVPNTDELSVSSSCASSVECSNKPLNLRGRINDLIEQQKQKLSKMSEKNSLKLSGTIEKRQGRPVVDSLSSAKKVFVQEPLEAAVESKVPYEKILQSIKASSFAKRVGRTSLKVNSEDEIRKQENLKKLRALEFFRCGSCGFDITKHKWIEHFLNHGGLAWIEGFEAPILLSDWNEAVRRTIHSFKIYNQVSLKCPNCDQEKRSALGHLSHVLVCCESETAIEEKKIPCAHCDERFLPFNASAHKSKCSGLLLLAHSSAAVENEQDDENDKDEITSESFNSSGRRKRKAVQNAEIKFKEILENLDDEATDHLQLTDGQLKCFTCGESNFASQKEALDHVKEKHNVLAENEFEALDSDTSIKGEDSSSETESSSGEDSSEIVSSDEANSENEEKIVSSKKARLPTTEPQEVKNGRGLICEYIDSMRHKDMTAKTIQWTQKFAEENWKTELLLQYIPRLLSRLEEDPKVVLPSLKFNLKSLFFMTKQVDSYSSSFGVEHKQEWKKLEIGQHDVARQSITIHCGGSVAAMDWAPTSSDLNFLAVACNSCSDGVKMDLKETTSSCVQIHEFKDLSHEKFQEFNSSSKLCYVIIIENGPVWSVKFHPSQSCVNKRIGLLAVATANQEVLIYSMPYLFDSKSIVLPISPNVVCKLNKGDILFNQNYLQQVLRLSWFVKSNGETILAAGYVSGLISVWNISDHSEDVNIENHYPLHVFQGHLEAITALDFKSTKTNEFHLVTASLDRKIKVFTFDDHQYNEISCHYAASRVLFAEWWLHWPGFLVGFDDCFSCGSIVHRQPLEFGSRNSQLLAVNSSIIHFNINHWLNFVMLVLESGDVLGCHPGQMLQTYPKDKWTYFNFSIFSSTDFNKIKRNGGEEIGIVFCDFETTIRQPKKYRQASVDRINELLINQVCFNRNEKSYRFYALGYETGFVRIRYLKNSK